MLFPANKGGHSAFSLVFADRVCQNHFMSGSAGASVGGLYYHVLNRGNRREVVFHKPEDYGAFIKATADACDRRPMDVLAYCLMPTS